MSDSAQLPAAQQAIVQQFLTQYDGATAGKTLAPSAAASPVPPAALPQFSAEEMAQIRQLLVTPTPSVTALLAGTTSVSDVAEKLKHILHSSSLGDLSSATATDTNSSSQSASPSSNAESTSARSTTGGVTTAAAVTSSHAEVPRDDSPVQAAGGSSEHDRAPASTSAARASTTMDIDQTAASANTTAAAMEIDTPNVAAAASSAAASSPATTVQGHLASIGVSHAKTVDGVLKNLLKLLTSLRKHPNLLANRKLRCDNIAVKKFVVDVPGAIEVLKFVGYQQVELTDKKTPYLIAEEAHLATPDAKSRLDLAIDGVTVQIAEYERIAAGGAAAVTAAKSAAPVEAKLCAGGCGFCGSAETEGFCSVCFKKKFLAGGTGPISPNKPAVASDPFVTPPRASAATSTAAQPAAASLSLSGLSAGTPGETKCLRHCGRLGSSAHNGFCSVCFERITAAGLKPPPKRWRCLFDGAMVKLRAVHRFNKGKKPVQENKSRCWVCSKKIGITGFECRCRYVFCSQHRYMEQHACHFDAKGLHKQKLKRENEEIRAAKIERI